MKRLFLPITIICLAFLLLAACDQRQKMAEIGKPAPGFELVDTNGKTWNLDDLKGKAVFLNFWATWCPPCRQELPSMQTVHATMPADTFIMLTILSNDDPAIATSLAAKIGATFPILTDPKNKAAQAYGLTGVPETYIIDKQGILREKFIGAVQWDSAESLQMLQKYISQ